MQTQARICTCITCIHVKITELRVTQLCIHVVICIRTVCIIIDGTGVTHRECKPGGTEEKVPSNYCRYLIQINNI